MNQITKTVRVVRVQRNVTEEPKVYDITVQKNHNFFVRTSNSQAALVHNCTPQAKEAMLKPLEEPAARTMWILCTTNPEKLSKTIIGRCQQIAVEAPTVKEMTQYLIGICKQEGIKVTKEGNLPILKHISEMSMGLS
jgi:DNA polymerase III gamma/tau subunit